MRKRRMVLMIGCILFVMMILMGVAQSTADQRELTVIEQTLRRIATPLENGIHTTGKQIGNFFGTFTEFDELQEENERLRQELTELNTKIHDQSEAMAENIRLRKMLEFKEQTREQFVLSAAEVIAENNNNLQHTIVLDKGTDDGVQNDMMVINYQGLIGRVINVLPKSCEVILITDRQGSVGARTYETRETVGVVEGRGSKYSYLRMIHLPHDADIVVGDTIVTSGLDGIFSAGIPIGTVIEIVDEADGLTKEATIETFVNFYRLEEVFIVLATQESE